MQEKFFILHFFCPGQNSAAPLQQDEGHAVVVPLQVPVPPQGGTALKGGQGVGVKDGEGLSGDVAPDLSPAFIRSRRRLASTRMRPPAPEEP